MTFTGLPVGVSVRDNEIGTAMALDRLARLLEGPSRPLSGRACAIARPAASAQGNDQKNECPEAWYCRR